MKRPTNARRPSTQQRMTAGPPVPPVYPCVDCGRPVATDGGQCVRCAGLAFRAAHPVPEAWAPGVAA